jgi:hypothetical protein
MSTPKHNLSNVDLENRKATCSVCGDTEIFVKHTPKQHKLVVGCRTKKRTYDLAVQRRIRAQKRLQDPDWKQKHKVTQINFETMTGICAVCGPTEVHKRAFKNSKYVTYLCKNKLRAVWMENYRKRDLPQLSSPGLSIQILAEQENQRLIDKHKVEHGCERCGYNADPRELKLHFGRFPEMEITESMVVYFTPKRLLHALRICETYCVICHSLLHPN